MSDLCLEDLHEGQALVSAATTMRAADMIAFAREFDPQPMHTDPVAAAHGRLGGLIASGWHTVAIAMRLQHESGLPSAGLAEIASLAWPMPVRPGDELHVRVEIVAVEEAAEDATHGLVRFQNTTINRAGETVQAMQGAVLVPRRSRSA